jgi:hypothetical protein
LQAESSGPLRISTPAFGCPAVTVIHSDTVFL